MAAAPSSSSERAVVARAEDEQAATEVARIEQRAASIILIRLGFDIIWQGERWHHEFHCWIPFRDLLALRAAHRALRSSIYRHCKANIDFLLHTSVWDSSP